MKTPYRILSNLSMWDEHHPKPFGAVWEPDDKLLCSHQGELTMPGIRTRLMDADAARRTAEMLFEIFNRDDRPNGHIAHSLSVGDVVIIGEVALACQSVGWKVVTGPFNIVTER